MRNIKSHFPSDRYELIPRVAIFSTHKARKNGVDVEVTRKDLEDIATTHNGMWERTANTAPFAYGHTRDNAPEDTQPSIYGNAVGLFIDREPGDPGVEYLFCTWAFPKAKISMLEQFVSLSPEYHPRKKLLWPISALKTSPPELPLPPIPKPCGKSGVFCYAAEDRRYRFVIPCRFDRVALSADADLVKAINKALAPGPRRTR